MVPTGSWWKACSSPCSRKPHPASAGITNTSRNATDVGYILNSKRGCRGQLAGQRVGGCRLLRHFPTQSARALAPGASPPENDWRRDEDGGISSDYDPDDDREREIAQDSAAKQEQTENRDERDRAGQNGAAQRLIDAGVHNLFDSAAPSAGQTFSNAVVYHDRVVD